MSLKGTIAEFPLPVLLRLLGDQKKTGELTLRGASGEGALGLADGRVVTAVFGDEPPIAALGAVFDMNDAQFEFMPWNDAPPANLEGDLDELLRRAEDHRKWLARVREAVPSDRTRFRLSARAADQGAVTFTPERWRGVLAVNGDRDVNDIAAHLGIDRNAALDLLAGLVRDGVIDAIEAAPEPEPPQQMSVPAEPSYEPAPAYEPAPLAPEPEPPAPAAEATPAEPAQEWNASPPATGWNATPAPAQEWNAPAPAQEWNAPPPTEPAPEPPAAMDDRLAALFGTPAAPAEPAPSQPDDRWSAPATGEWTTPASAADEWAAPTTEVPSASDPRLGALSMPPAPAEAEPATPPRPTAPVANEWAPPAEAPAPQKKSLFGRFRKEEPAAAAPAYVERAATSRAAKLAAFSNALLAEYNSGAYGRARIDDRIGGLLMRVDEQADPIDRPLPVMDDRLDVQAIERVNVPEAQAVPYLALLVSTIYADAERAFGRDKAKKGYKAAQQQAFGGDTSALAGPDIAGKLPKV